MKRNEFVKTACAGVVGLSLIPASKKVIGGKCPACGSIMHKMIKVSGKLPIRLGSNNRVLSNTNFKIIGAECYRCGHVAAESDIESMQDELFCHTTFVFDKSILSRG